MGKLIGRICTEEKNKLIEIQQIDTDAFNQLKIDCQKTWWKFEGRKRKKCETNFLLYNRYLPIGFWNRLYKMNEKGHSPKIVGAKDFFNLDITREKIVDWIDTLDFKDENISPRWYQIDALVKALKWRITRGSFATGAGKTLILYLVCRYLLEHKIIRKNKKILIVVPSVMLVNQTYNDINDDYQTDELLQVDRIYSGSTRTPNANIVVGNIDSLIERDLDFFKQFDVVLYDEAHKLSTQGYRRIWEYLLPNDLKMVYSVSGSWHEKNSIDDLMAESISGALMMHVTTEQLIKEKSLTPVNIKCVKFNYENGLISQGYYMDKRVNNENLHNDGELKYIRAIRKRMEKISKIVERTEYNQLLLFKSKQYAKDFVDYLKLLCPDKEVRLIVGEISDVEREEIKKFTEQNNNVIICATYGTMSTGVSIKNLSTLHFVEGAKSFIWVRQSIGRVLRLHKNKKVAIVYDYSDHIKKPKGIKSEYDKTISSNHLKERIKIYNKQKFPYKIYDMVIEK